MSARGDGEPHVLGTAVATFCQEMGQSGKRTKHALFIRLITKVDSPLVEIPFALVKFESTLYRLVLKFSNPPL